MAFLVLTSGQVEDRWSTTLVDLQPIPALQSPITKTKPAKLQKLRLNSKLRNRKQKPLVFSQLLVKSSVTSISLDEFSGYHFPIFPKSLWSSQICSGSRSKRRFVKVTVGDACGGGSTKWRSSMSSFSFTGPWRLGKVAISPKKLTWVQQIEPIWTKKNKSNRWKRQNQLWGELRGNYWLGYHVYQFSGHGFKFGETKPAWNMVVKSRLCQ